MEKIQHQNLTKRKNNILFRTEHLMHVTKKEKEKKKISLFCVSNFLLCV
jgi:hypothetical protein